MSLPIATVPMSEQTNLPKVLVPTGTHFARIFKIIDLGTQKSEYKGQEKINRQFSFSFEFPKVKHVFKPENGEQPLARSKDLNFIFTSKESPNRSGLTNLVEAVGDDPFTGNYNIFSLLGKACQVTVEHYKDKNGNDKDKITNFTKLSDEQKEMVELKPETYMQINRDEFLYLDPNSFDLTVFESLPSWLQDKIKLSLEYNSLNENKPKVSEKPKANLPDVDNVEINLDEITTQMPF